MSDTKITSCATAADILSGIGQTPIEMVKAPGLDKPVRMFGLTGVEKAELFDACTDEKGNVDDDMLDVMVVIYCARDEKGNRLFSDDQFMELRNHYQRTLRPLTQVAWKLSGYGLDAMKAIAKNLQKIPSDDS